MYRNSLGNQRKQTITTGKSTQLPQYLLECGWASDGRAIAVTQPRRVAVTTLASRVAEERGSVVGDEIGYTVSRSAPALLVTLALLLIYIFEFIVQKNDRFHRNMNCSISLQKF